MRHGIFKGFDLLKNVSHVCVIQDTCKNASFVFGKRRESRTSAKQIVPPILSYTKS